MALTIALGAGASVLLLDEPLASLDPLARHEFTAAVRAQTAARGVTTVISSHIVGDLDAFCDRIVVLGGGFLVLDAPIADVIAQHGVLPAQALHGRVPIGVFPRADGSMTALVHDVEGALERPTLEDLVKGYLAAARSRASGR